VADPRAVTRTRRSYSHLLEQRAQSKGLPLKNNIMQNVMSLPNVFLNGSNDIKTIKLIRP
jgi:hypothetical protein